MFLKKIGVVFILLACGTLLHANTEFHAGSGWKQYEFRNETVADSGTVSAKFNRVGSYDYLDFNLSASSGNITTANVSWLLSDGTEAASEELTSGTAITVFKSSHLKVTLTNNVGQEVTITGNIIISK